MDTGGTREILGEGDAAAGLVVSDPAGLTDAVADIVRDAALRRDLSERARARAAAYAPAALVPRYEAVYRRLG